MSNAPERIWIDAWGGNWSSKDGGTQDVEYICADLVDAIIAATLERAAGEAYYTCGSQDAIHALNTPETRAAILADAMKSSVSCANLKGQTNE